jgi:hypothetical protein
MALAAVFDDVVVVVWPTILNLTNEADCVVALNIYFSICPAFCSEKYY